MNMGKERKVTVIFLFTLILGCGSRIGCIWSCRILPCSFICNIYFVVSFLFDGLACVPLLPVVWPEVSNNGVCRLLGGAQGKVRMN